MDQAIFDKFCTSAQQFGVVFYYDGEFSESVIATMAGSVRKRLTEANASVEVSRRMFSSFIEMVMNILHYSPSGEGAPSGTVIVGTERERYFIACGNRMLTEHVERLSGKLEPVTKMTAEEIRKAYKAQLRNDDHDDDELSKGAGLGILTVARDASAPIQFSFTTVQDKPQLSNFFMKVIF